MKFNLFNFYAVGIVPFLLKDIEFHMNDLCLKNISDDSINFFRNKMSREIYNNY